MMTALGPMAVQRIDAWQEKFLANDHGDDAWVIDLLRRGVRDARGAPLLFRAATRCPAFQFLSDKGVDLMQRGADGSTLLMDMLDIIDVDAFDRLAALFAAAGAVDLADHDGITPLSSSIRFGRLEKARLLLKHGASPNAIAHIRRYGDAPLDIATQAVLCIPFEGDRETISIAALELLKQHGLDIGKPARERLKTQIPDRCAKLRRWVDDHI